MFSSPAQSQFKSFERLRGGKGIAKGMADGKGREPEPLTH